MFKIISNKIFIGVFVMLAIGFLIYLLKIGNYRPSKITAKNPRLQIVTSFYPLYFFTTQIVHDKADVHNITPAGAEPHDYEPTTRDMVKIENSQILIINGGKFEAWADNVQNILDKQNISIINISEHLANQDTVEKNIQTRDPHFWLDPILAKKEAELIFQNLIIADPVNTNFYTDNSKILIDKLENLNTKFKTELSNCQKKHIVTSHAAFKYLAQRYNFNQISISGLSPDEEPTPKQLADIADLAQKNKIQYIFFESLINPKLANTIAQEIGANTLVLNPIEGLTDEEIKNGKNYFTEMQNNLTNLKIALQCQ